MYWIRGFVLQGLRALNLTALDFEEETGQVNATTAHAVERIVGIVTSEAGLTALERSEIPGSASAAVDGPGSIPVVRCIRERDWSPSPAPVPSDRTERPMVGTRVHRVEQRRRCPSRLPRSSPAQAADGHRLLRPAPGADASAAGDLARDAGISGFMYYHYWFAGQELLEGPIRSRLTGNVDLPFCLMWANENWTKRWDGRGSDVLIGQHYEEVPAAALIDDVMPILRDPRYMRIDGRPLIAIYRPAQIPDTAKAIVAWRDAARREGIGELFVMNVDVAKEFDGVSPATHAEWGLDGSLGFPPHNALWDWLPHQHVGAVPGFGGNILSYQSRSGTPSGSSSEGRPIATTPGSWSTSTTPPGGRGRRMSGSGRTHIPFDGGWRPRWRR